MSSVTVSVTNECDTPANNFVKMKEILYIQAGKLSNYTGTHFWNTQESYLALNEFQDHTEVDSGVSFCENVDDKVSVRYLIQSSLIHL